MTTGKMTASIFLAAAIAASCFSFTVTTALAAGTRYYDGDKRGTVKKNCTGTYAESSTGATVTCTVGNTVMSCNYNAETNDTACNSEQGRTRPSKTRAEGTGGNGAQSVGTSGNSNEGPAVN